jgi:hypothetical protein
MLKQGYDKDNTKTNDSQSTKTERGGGGGGSRKPDKFLKNKTKKKIKNNPK